MATAVLSKEELKKPLSTRLSKGNIVKVLRATDGVYEKAASVFKVDVKTLRKYRRSHKLG